MTLSDLHTHTSSDKADTLKTHPDHSEGLSVSVQTLSPLSAHQLILFASNNETLLTAETGPDIMRPKKNVSGFVKGHQNDIHVQLDGLDTWKMRAFS